MSNNLSPQYQAQSPVIASEIGSYASRPSLEGAQSFDMAGSSPSGLARVLGSSATALQGLFSWISKAIDACKEGTEVDDDEVIKPQGVKRKNHASDGRRRKRAHTSRSSSGITVSEDFEVGFDRLHSMKHSLGRRVCGQEGPIDIVSRAVCRLSLRDQSITRPLASFLFLGPQGVGKTELAKTLAIYLSKSYEQQPLAEIDMSRYRAADAVPLFISKVSGIMQGARLDQSVLGPHWEPPKVLVFQKIDKAHANIARVVLDVVKEGLLVDEEGQQFSFNKTIVCLSTRSGCHAMYESGATHLDGTITPQARSDLMNGLKTAIMPELLDAVDQRVAFNALGRRALDDIARLHVGIARQMLRPLKINFNISPNTAEWLVELSSHREIGPRYIVDILRKACQEAARKSQEIEGQGARRLELLSLKKDAVGCPHASARQEEGRCMLCPDWDREVAPPSVVIIDA